MSEEEFIKQRCEIDKMTLEEFEQTYRVVKCTCGNPFCKGYRCLDLNDLFSENQHLQQRIDKAIGFIDMIYEIGSYSKSTGLDDEEVKELYSILQGKE